MEEEEEFIDDAKAGALGPSIVSMNTNKLLLLLVGVSLPQERSTVEQVFYTWVEWSRSESSSFTA